MTEPTATIPNAPPIPPKPPVPTAKNIVSILLKDPERISETIAGQRSLLRASLMLLFAGVICHVVFGLAIGFFGGWSVAAMDMVKVPLVALCSLLLCFPSLYVFTCVAGSPLTLSQTILLGCSCMAMVGLILVGLAPVAWLFSVSTSNLSFVTLLTFILWLIAIGFASRFVGKLGVHPLFQRQGGIKLWFLILMLVTLQMATCMRPMLTKPESGWWTSEKEFFLSHFTAAINQGDSGR